MLLIWLVKKHSQFPSNPSLSQPKTPAPNPPSTQNSGITCLLPSPSSNRAPHSILTLTPNSSILANTLFRQTGQVSILPAQFPQASTCPHS